LYLLITGIPRSGTTLTSAWVDLLQNTVCLNEPPRHYAWVFTAKDRHEYVQKCSDDLRDTREALVAGNPVRDRREAGGAVPTNYFSDSGRRQLSYSLVQRPSAGSDLLLAIKHNEPFTAVLPELTELAGTRVIAVVRHPIPTLLSWRSRPIPLSKGNLSAGYRFWPEALAARNESGSIDELQVRIYEQYCKRYWENRDRIVILRYESLIEDTHLIERLTGRNYTTRDYEAPRTVANRARPEQQSELASLKAFMAEHFDYAYRFYPDLDNC